MEAGSTIWLTAFQNTSGSPSHSESTSSSPVCGSMLSRKPTSSRPGPPTQPSVAYSMISPIRPSQKVGLEYPTSPTMRVRWSKSGAAVDRRQHAQRHAQPDADQDREARQLQRRREGVRQVVRDPVPREQRVAEVPGQHVAQVQRELHRDGTVEAKLVMHHVVGRLVRLLADDGQHRVGRQHPAHDERQRQQPEQRRQHRPGLPRDARRAAHAGATSTRCRS